MRILDQAEREKIASEDEIEKLRDALHGLHREERYPRYPRNNPPPRPMATSAAAEPSTAPEAESDEPADEDTQDPS
jgi:hypothetical protein